MKTAAAIPASRAAHATAWPWLPALAATTPAARSSGESVAIGLTAPRILTAPVRWRFSALSGTERPVSRENVSDGNTGVTRAIPPRRLRAASTSASVGAAVVGNSIHLLQDLTHGRERVELAGLHLVEQTAQLRLVRDRRLQVRLGPARRDGEDLAGEVPAAAPLQPPPRLQEARDPLQRPPHP